MVHKTECPGCKGDKIVRVKSSDGRSVFRACPECNGQGFKVRLVRH